MRLKPLAGAFFLCAAIALTADVTFACSCGPKPPVLDSYERSDAVLIARVLSVDPLEDKDEDKKADQKDFAWSGAARWLVEKVYKGSLRVNGEFRFGFRSNAACFPTFGQDNVGHQFLLYLFTAKEAPDVWFGSICGRTRMLEYAREDLLYLDNIEKLRGKTRVSGSYLGWRDVKPDVANRTIRIVGEKKTYETQTDAHGVFEIYDLPAGAYSVEPELPNGWRLARWALPSNLSIEGPLKSLPITLKPNRHATINLVVEPSNGVEGRVVGPDGNPLSGACVHLRKPDSDKDSGFGCTDKSGFFGIGAVPAGSYIAVLNPDEKVRSDELYPRLFYPSVAQRERAALITVPNGETVKGIDFVVSSLAETVTVSGILLFSDGKPAAEHLVTFAAVAKDGVDGENDATTGKDGRFKLKLVKGLKGEIFGEFYASFGEYERCPKLDALIKETGKQLAFVKSPSIKIVAEQDIENVVLRFTFPRCKRKEE